MRLELTMDGVPDRIEILAPAPACRIDVPSGS